MRYYLMSQYPLSHVNLPGEPSKTKEDELRSLPNYIYAARDHLDTDNESQEYNPICPIQNHTQMTNEPTGLYTQTVSPTILTLLIVNQIITL